GRGLDPAAGGPARAPTRAAAPDRGRRSKVAPGDPGHQAGRGRAPRGRGRHRASGGRRQGLAAPAAALSPGAGRNPAVSGSVSEAIAIRPAGPFDLALLAELHGTCFDDPWSVAALADLLAMPGALALLASTSEVPQGFAILRTIAGEGEIISI